ncbi:MmgE/PrpD family protein [Mesorhizobium caraganae]|uniref:MmgE/PrpD family protein n=1 Tax=Mesorhizobium caraganae TaxID=483206 RepID=A0ABV1ZA24_9HYPH
MHAINELAKFVSNFPAEEVLAAGRERIYVLVLDLLGAAAAGIDTPLAKAARTAALESYGQGEIDIWVTGMRTSVVGAAMANSAAASALDIDDGHRGAGGHPGAGIIPAALAVAQAVGASGSELMGAIALGYEVGLRVASCRPLQTIEMHASGRWVNFGVAAAASRLLGLSADQTAHALAIAGCEGPVIFLNASSKFDGTSIKEGIPPAVVAGITAAYRAQAGAKGPIELLNDDERFTRNSLTGNLGSSWEIQNCYIKPYACCRYIHGAIDAILSIRKSSHPVFKLRIETFPHAMRLANERAPSTLEGGQYSFYFNCAVAALYGPTALQLVQPEHFRDSQVLELAARIELEPSLEFANAFPALTPARVILDQGYGPEEMVVLHPLGDTANPLSIEQIEEKFRNITRDCIGSQWQVEIVAAVSKLHTAGSAALFAALVPPHKMCSEPASELEVVPADD